MNNKDKAVDQPTKVLTDEQIMEIYRHEQAKAYLLEEPVVITNLARAIERAAIAAHLAKEPKAEQPAWTTEPPTEQGDYWNWDGDDDHAPMIYHVLWSGTAKKCFVSIGQYGIDEAIWCDNFGGQWMKIEQPSTHAPVAPAGAQNAEAIRNQAEPEQIECWSRDEEDFNARSLSELLDSHDDLKPGDTVWVGEAVHPDPARLVNEDGIIENIGEAAYDIGGEYAEDYPEVTPAQAKELESLVADWIKRTCPPTFYTVANVKPYVLSHEDFPHDSTPIQVDLPDALRTNPATPASKGDAS